MVAPSTCSPGSRTSLLPRVNCLTYRKLMSASSIRRHRSARASWPDYRADRPEEPVVALCPALRAALLAVRPVGAGLLAVPLAEDP